MKAFVTICALLFCLTAIAQPPDREKLPEHSQKVMTGYDEALQKARDEFLEKVQRERERAIQRLEIHLKAATRKGDFDEAQALKDMIEALKKETVQTDEAGLVVKLDGLDPQVREKLKQRVTLKKPFPERWTKHSKPDDHTWICFAVEAMAKQVGLKYNYATTREKSGDAQLHIVPATFEDVTFAHALEVLCKPQGLKVKVVDGDTIVLTK